MHTTQRANSTELVLFEALFRKRIHLGKFLFELNFHFFQGDSQLPFSFRYHLIIHLQVQNFFYQQLLIKTQF